MKEARSESIFFFLEIPCLMIQEKLGLWANGKYFQGESVEYKDELASRLARIMSQLADEGGER